MAESLSPLPSALLDKSHGFVREAERGCNSTAMKPHHLHSDLEDNLVDGSATSCFVIFWTSLSGTPLTTSIMWQHDVTRRPKPSRDVGSLVALLSVISTCACVADVSHVYMHSSRPSQCLAYPVFSLFRGVVDQLRSCTSQE